MNRQPSHRILVATAVAALFAGGIANAAIRPQQDADGDRAQSPRKEHRRDAPQARSDQRRQDAPQARADDRRNWQQDRNDDRREAAQQSRNDDRRETARQDRGDNRRDWQQARRDDQRDARRDRNDDRRDWQQDRRNDQRDWRQDAARRDAARRDAQRRDDMQRRVAYARYRQDYDRRARDIHIHVAPRYYVRPAHYRYFYGGSWYSTSNYGADVLRQAVDWGYREGMRAGRADRYDGWAADYRDSVAWRDAGFGYGGRYVSRADYAYYFRQGFQRGYDDGYFGRMQYGRYVDNNVVIAEAVIATILGLQLLR